MNESAFASLPNNEKETWKPNPVTQLSIFRVQNMSPDEILLYFSDMKFPKSNLGEIGNMDNQDMADFFVQAKLAEGITLYKDLKHINEIPENSFFEDARPFVLEFRKKLNGPIIFDGIEDVKVPGNDPDQKPRQVTREIINKLSPKLYKFWESNKLQSSNIAGTISGINDLSNMGLMHLSGDLKQRLENLRQSIHIDEDGSENPFSANRYKRYLKTREKLEVVKSFETFLEDVILEQVEKK